MEKEKIRELLAGAALDLIVGLLLQAAAKWL